MIPPERLAKLERTIGLMYSAESLETSMFAKECSFDDPAAACKGFEEIAEAFRALRALEPSPIRRRVASVEAGRNIVRFDSLMGYTINGYKTQLPSTIVVRDDGTGRIESITELWNHQPLLPLSGITRRINGLASYHLTRLLL